MTEKRTITVTVRITGLRPTLAKFKALPKNADKEMRAASLSIAGVLAVDIKNEARANAQSALMVPTIRAVRDRVPVVQGGGARRVGSNRVPAFKVLFGAEFGSHSLGQFRPFNTTGYFFFPTVDESRDWIDREFNDAADEVLAKWGGL